jgi:hypothetical protein
MSDIPAPNWKDVAVEAYRHEKAEQERLYAAREAIDHARARDTMRNLLAKVMPDTDALRAGISADGQRAELDGIRFSTYHREWSVELCLLGECPECRADILSHTIDSPVDLGRQLQEFSFPHHRCEPEPVNYAALPLAAPEPSLGERLEALIRAIVAETLAQTEQAE